MGKAIAFENMTYRQFKAWCEEGALDGLLGVSRALSCQWIIKEVENAAKGKLFKSKARERAWNNIKSKYIKK